MTRHAYQEWEIETIVRLFPDVQAICAALTGRTAGGIRAKAGQLGLRATQAKAWASWELRAVRRLHPDLDAVRKALPHRTRDAIKFRVRVLGIGKRHKRWTPERNALLTRLANQLPDNELAKIFGTTARAVAYQRSQLGVAGNRKMAGETSRTAVVHDVRQQAEKRGISLYRITKALRCQQLKPSQTDAKVSWISVVRVVNALGGELYVEWDD